MRTNAIVSCLVLFFHNVCCTEDTWVEPHDWTKPSADSLFGQAANNEDFCQCQAPTEKKSLATIEDQLALIYFKKFVNTLFRREKLQHSKTTKLFKRSLLFTLQPAQLEELETVQDARDLDIILNKILDETRDLPLYTAESDYRYSHQGMGFRALVADMFKDFVQLLRISEVKFLLAVLLSIAMGWLVRKRYRIPVFIIVVGFVFLFGYFHTYLECNRKMEVDAMIEVIDNHQERSVQSSWFSRLFSFLSMDTPVEQQKKRLIKSTKVIMPFCRPDHVFVMYTSDMFIKQIEMLLEKTTETMTKLTTGLSFPYNLIAPFALVFLIGYMLKLTFKYIISPKVWIQLMHKKSAPPIQGAQQAAIAGGAAGDSLSGENLKMLLNVVNRAQLISSESQSQLAVSGVQEVLEQLEAPPPTTASPTKLVKPPSRDTSSEQLNVSSSFADIAQEAGFTVVDDNADDDENVDKISKS